MSTKKLNCWEFMRCKREPGGNRADKDGTCVAAMDSSYDGINCGKNAGRICWAVAGTCCGGEIQGTFAEKRIHVPVVLSTNWFRKKKILRIPPTKYLTIFQKMK